MRARTTRIRNQDPREAMRVLPRWMQWMLTELTGKPLHDEKMPFRWRWWQRLALALASLFVGLFGSMLLAGAGLLGWLLLPITWLFQVSALRAFQTTFVHHASHKNLSGMAWLDKIIGESLSIVAWIMPLREYTEGHMLGHHPRLGLLVPRDEPVDPDLRFIVNQMGFRPGRSHGAYWLQLGWLLISPAFHAWFFLARTRANLITAKRTRRCLAWAFVTSVLAGVAFTGSWFTFLVVVIVPWTWLYQVSGVLQVLTEHTWVRRGTGTVSGKHVYARLTNARFVGVAPPDVELPMARRMIAWAVWGVRMLFCCLPVRLFVLPGDLPQHDLHHRRPRSDWANAAYARRDDAAFVAADAPDFREIWGFVAALRATFDELSNLPPNAQLGDPLTYGESNDTLLRM